MIARISAALLLALLAACPARATVVISNAMTNNMSCSAGMCSPTAKNAVLNAGDLQGMLASSDVKIVTGSGAVEIHVMAPVTWASASRLTLDAKRSISIKAAIVSEGTGGVTITTNDGGSGGELLFVSGGSISFWDNSSSLIVDGNAYTLVSDIATLASGIAGNPTGFYALAKDYDAGPHGVYSGAAVTSDFNGTFEGLGHTIANLAVTGDDRVGLFGNAGSEASPAVLRDLALANVVIQVGDRAEGGALAGVVDGIVENESSSGSVTVGNSSAGDGLAGGVGGSTGLIVNSFSTASVVSGTHGMAGGLVGMARAISLSHATGNVTAGAGNEVGGLAGFVFGGSVSRSYATGNVMSKNPQKTQIMGGLVGDLDHADVSDCYSTGSVQAGGASPLGGMFGEFYSETIATSYSVGAVVFGTAPAGAPFGRPRVGGFLGRYVGGAFTADYWDLDTSGEQNACDKTCSGVEGLSDAEFKSGLPAGFDPAIWGQSAGINNGYPYLLANPPQP